MKLMTCPRCNAEFVPGVGSCPECGVQLLRSIAGVMKTSAVMIAAGRESGFYRSVEDVPEPLRATLIEATSGSNSGTIVIADRAGKEQISLGMNRHGGLREGGTAKTNPAGPLDWLWSPRFLPWVAALLLLIAAAILAAAFMTR